MISQDILPPVFDLVEECLYVVVAVASAGCNPKPDVDFGLRVENDVHARDELPVSTAFAVAAVLADQAALLVDEVGGAALLAFLSGLVLGTVGYVLFEGAFHSVLPGVDGLVVEVQALYEVQDIDDGHAVADDARDELGVVPELWQNMWDSLRGLRGSRNGRYSGSRSGWCRLRVSL